MTGAVTDQWLQKGEYTSSITQHTLNTLKTCTATLGHGLGRKGILRTHPVLALLMSLNVVKEQNSKCQHMQVKRVWSLREGFCRSIQWIIEWNVPALYIKLCINL